MQFKHKMKTRNTNTKVYSILLVGRSLVFIVFNILLALLNPIDSSPLIIDSLQKPSPTIVLHGAVLINNENIHVINNSNNNGSHNEKIIISQGVYITDLNNTVLHLSKNKTTSNKKESKSKIHKDNHKKYSTKSKKQNRLSIVPQKEDSYFVKAKDGSNLIVPSNKIQLKFWIPFKENIHIFSPYWNPTIISITIYVLALYLCISFRRRPPPKHSLSVNFFTN